MTQKIKIVLGIALIFALIAGWRLFSLFGIQAGDPAPDAATAAIPVAAVVRAEEHSLGVPLALAGAFKPFQDVDVHAKVAGYIRTIYVDVGTHVKNGQTIAVLEVPELAAELSGASAAVRRSQQEIQKAQGDVERAKSTHYAAHAMYERLKQASEQKAGLVAEQELDNAQAKDLEAEAGVSSAQAASNSAQQAREVAEANQKQYSALSDYTRIIAPFDGVVTARYADTGALVAAGTSSSSQAMPVVRIAQISVLRLVLPVPESIAGTIRLDDPVKVHVQALNQDYVGKVSRFADTLNPQTRTMETEIDFQNADGKLLPGMYVEASLARAAKKQMLTIPLEAVQVNGTEGTVLFVNSQDVLEERNVRLGLQGSMRIEVLSGLQLGDRVIVGSLNEFRVGMKVRPKEIDAGQPGQTGGR
jgi:RND family efflux transporter MFP subunit